MHCMHKNRLNCSDLSSDHACRILDGWLAGWLAGRGKPGSNGLEMVTEVIGIALQRAISTQLTNNTKMCKGVGSTRDNNVGLLT